MSDLVKRLRGHDEYEPLGHDGWEAADRIEQLERELAAARQAVQHANDHADAAIEELAAEKAKLADWQYHQQYRYIGIDGKPALARDLEDRALKAEVELAAEKALADRLYYVAMFREDDPTHVINAYRKARGL